MSTQQTFSDEELTAYLDGEHDHSRTDIINKALSSDPHLRDRLEQLSINKKAIRDAFDSLLAEAPPLSSVIKNSTKINFSLPKYIMGIAAMITLSVTIGWQSHQQFNNQPNNDWKTYVAAYQALYTRNTLAHINNPTRIQQAELQRVSVTLGKELILGKIKDLPQLHYKRAQILAYKGQPLVQLAFLSSMDTPIALCIIRSEDKQNSKVTLSNMEGMVTASWTKNGYAFLLIGGNDQYLIQSTANNFFAYL